jgi:hypothetical protein
MIRNNRPIRTNEQISMNLGMCMDCPLDVESLENSLPLHHTVAISWPHPTQECGVSAMQINTLGIGDVELSEEFFEWSVGR